jgi:UDP-N-acetylmuramate: L-alanyl-gamma-D-glutamyl-meso-diaminopimelate ligase
MTNWVHFIGICGTATGQIAVEYKKNGFLVSGSEKGLYPPMSDHIIDNDIHIEIGYKPEHLKLEYYQNKYGGEWNIHERQYPDEIIYVGSKGSQNPEYTFAKDQQLDIKFYPQVLKERVVIPEKSVVIAGTYGKTTITSMLAWIFIHNGIDVSYMFGGLNPNMKNGARFKSVDTKLSIIEGDEYMISFSDQRSKFFEYSPKYLVLTSTQWDHTDMFETKQEYLFNFKTLLDSIPSDGFVLVNDDNPNLDFLLSGIKCDYSRYSDYEMKVSNETGKQDKFFELKVIGKHNQSNALAAYAMAEKLGTPLGLNHEKIVNGIETYLGIRRRLEIKLKTHKNLVIDDFGSTPHKARVAINSVIEENPDKPLYVIFEPNSGSRTARSISEYQHTFDKPNIKKLFLPRFTNIKGEYLDNTSLSEKLKLLGVESETINDDDKLVEAITKNAEVGGIVIFLGSHGFRGMINKVVKKLENK